MIGAGERIDGTIRRRVDVDGPTGHVAGLLHVPAETVTSLPVVMLGHGGGGAKDDPQWQAVARFLAREVPAAVLCIDGPFHGDRAPAAGDEPEQVGGSGAPSPIQ